MDSRASSASDGEVLEPQQQKAITNHQPAERTINNSNRAFGLKNASKSYGKSLCFPCTRAPHRLTRPGVDHKSRDLSRSPSPYRHKHNRSTSPLQYHRKRDDSRSPSPYRHKRDEPRSPSPYRHKRDDSRSPSPYRHSSDHVPDANASRSQHKRKGSPRGTSRPDKRHQTDRSRYNDRPPKSHLDSVRAVLHSTHTERRQARPFSYADNEVPPSVPDFRNGLKVQNGSHHHQRSEHQRGSQDRGQPAVDTRATASSVPASEVKDVDM
jgi:serine/threonine-protein kinase PRP4